MQKEGQKIKRLDHLLAHKLARNRGNNFSIAIRGSTAATVLSTGLRCAPQSLTRCTSVVSSAQHRTGFLAFRQPAPTARSGGPAGAAAVNWSLASRSVEWGWLLDHASGGACLSIYMDDSDSTQVASYAASEQFLT